MPLPEDFGRAFETPLAPAPQQTPTVGLPSGFGESFTADDAPDSPLDMVERHAQMTAGQNSSGFFKDKQTADELGLSVDLVARNRETTQLDAFKSSLRKTLSFALGTAAFFAEDRHNFLAAKDEAATLAGIEKDWREDEYGVIRATRADEIDTLERLRWNLQEGVKDVTRSTLGAFRGLFDFFAQKDQEAMASLPAEMRDKLLAERAATEADPIRGVMQILPEEGQQALTELVKAPGLETDLPLPTSDPVQQYWQDVVRMVPQIGAQIGAALVGGVPLSMGFMGAQIAGGTYNQLADEGVTPDRALAASFANAIMQAPLESIGIGRMLSFMGGGAAAAPVKEAIKTVGTEFITEWLQQYPDTFTNIWALAKNNGQDLSGVVQQFADEFWETTKEGAYQGLVAAPFGGVMGAPAIASAYIDGKKAERTQAYVDKLIETHKAVQATQVQQNDPVLMERFLDVAGLGEDIYIDGEALLQSPEILQRLGLDQTMVEAAAESGHSVRVSTSTLWTRLSEQEMEAIREDIRPAPSAMSAREAAAYDPVQALKEIEDLTLGEAFTVDPMEQDGEWASAQIEVDGATATAGEVVTNLRSRMSEYQKFVECMG